MAQPIQNRPPHKGNHSAQPRPDTAPAYYRDDARAGLTLEIEAARDPDALLRLPVVVALAGKSRSGIYAAVAAGTFPQPIRLGARCTRWRAGDVRAWLNAQAAA